MTPREAENVMRREREALAVTEEFCEFTTRWPGSYEDLRKLGRGDTIAVGDSLYILKFPPTITVSINSGITATFCATPVR